MLNTAERRRLDAYLDRSNIMIIVAQAITCLESTKNVPANSN